MWANMREAKPSELQRQKVPTPSGSLLLHEPHQALTRKMGRVPSTEKGTATTHTDTHTHPYTHTYTLTHTHTLLLFFPRKINYNLQGRKATKAWP